MEVVVLFDSIKLGAKLHRIQVMRTNYHGIRKVGMHPFHQNVQGTDLLVSQC